MEEILVLIEDLLKSEESEERLPKNFYKKISKYAFTEDNELSYLTEYILPKLHLLYDKHILKKDILYLSLISYNNFDILKRCIEYDKCKFKLNIQEPSSLYDYGIFEKQHWLQEILKNYASFDKCFGTCISQKIFMLKLIEMTNIPDIDIKQIKLFLENVNTIDTDDFWKFYIKKIKYFEKIMDIFKDQIKTTTDLNEVFIYVNQHCILESFSNYLDISKVEWNEILNKIYEEEELNQNSSDIQSQHFIAFYILGSILNLILIENASKINVNKILEDVKTKIFSIKNKLLQIEVLENIFAILFFKKTYLFDNQTDEKLVCKEKEVRLILHFIKTIIDDIKIKVSFDKESNEYSRFNNLNKFVIDAVWRTELIENVKSPEKCETNLLRYLLSSPTSLIHMSIKCGDFNRAYQVIEIFGLENVFLSKELQYIEKIQMLRRDLKKSFRIYEIQKLNPSTSISKIDINETIQMFFKNNPIPCDSETEHFITELAKQKQLFSHLKSENEIFMNMFDLAITQPKHFEHNANMINLAFDNYNLEENIYSNYNEFCIKLFELWKEIGHDHNLTPSDIIISPHHSLNIDKFKKEEEFYIRLLEFYSEFNNNLNIDETGVLNSNHPSHKSLLKLNSLCNEFVEQNRGTKGDVKYIAKLYNYLKAFSKILYIEQDSSDIVSHGRNSSFFNLLYYNRSELMGKLLFERHLNPSEFEKYFSKLKLDYLYHVIGNCFPTINLHSEENVTKEELYPENNLYIPSKNIITYIQKRNWLLAFILSEMYKVRDVKIDISEMRVRPFMNYMKLPKINCLKVLFENNEIVTTLQNEISTHKVSQYINIRILRHDYLTSSQYSQHSSDSFEAAQEILEDAIKTTNWKELYDIIESIPENQLQKTPSFVELKDMILVNLVQDRFEIDYFQYVQFISDGDLRINTILSNIKQWPGKFCIDVIKSEITKFGNFQIPKTKLTELKTWLQHIQLCEELKDMVGVSNWSKAHEMCENTPINVISKLLLSDKILVLLQFIGLHKPAENLLLEINENFLVTIFDTVDSYEPIKILLDYLPYNHSIQISYNLLKYLKNLDSLQFVTDYLSNNVSNDLLKNVQISLKMLSTFTQTEQEQLLCLIHEPEDIIEVLIMNTKLDKLSTVLNIVRSEIENTEFNEHQLSIEKIDEMLRMYAEKSLDFRVITQPNPRLLRTPECKLMQSLDSISLCGDNRGFIMPEEVPTKDEWVQNNEVLECMCCKKITFSMFNRRHHCRRCGRVVCYNCSTRRMLVPTYEDILVRVCEECYHQTVGESTSEYNDTASTKSVLYEYWLLTDDFEHNKIVREEFSYEHAPSVSLCLSIMKYHSKTVEYPKFLLDQCDIMLKLLQPSQEPIQEIDYLLVIKMLKSLAIAGKMISVECALQYGTSSADRILSQAELLGLLAERGCLGLLPISNGQRGSFIDASVLRKLRDRLLEREQWNLALEVSTKAGLDTTGVFAIWGKSCLKAGSLILAREKFQRCLDKTGHYESFSDTNSQSEFDVSQDSMTRLKYSSKVSNLGVVLETKPSKNPPLLDEIIYILESKTIPISSDVIKTVENQALTSSTLSLNKNLGTNDMAVCIISKLRNLKNISNGNYYQTAESDISKMWCNNPPIDNIFYDECVYYLTKYGTHLSLLEFYVKHGDISTALNYIIDGQLSTDIFTDIYMRCLKDGVINVLHEHMSTIDSTLNVWKDYLKSLCRHLEKHNMLHSLYQLQQFMGDYIRAAMTCIRFYQENVKSFTDLLGNVTFLDKAEQHLRNVLAQDQWVEVASVRKQSVVTEGSYEEKSLTNPSLVMKMTPKDINRNIDTIWKQKDVVTFLVECEASDVKPMDLLNQILHVPEPSPQLCEKQVKIPTLFGTAQEKMHLAVLAIICGKNVEDGFNVALSIIQEFKLKPVKVYCEAGKQLAKADRYTGIGQLVSCIKNSGMNDVTITEMCDEMLTLAVATFTKANVSGAKVEDLIKLISDRATKISAYIEAKQLKTAYFLAVKYKRMTDIRRILREAELLNQPNIKTLCQKVLLSQSHAPTH